MVFLKSTGTALGIGYAAVVEDLQQDVEHIRVRLFNFVEEHDGVGRAAHSLGELAALVVADVSRRRADEARDGVFFHVLGHVYAHHVALVVEETLGEGFCQLGLADAGGAEEEEAAYRPVGVGDACAGAHVWPR